MKVSFSGIKEEENAAHSFPCYVECRLSAAIAKHICERVFLIKFYMLCFGTLALVACHATGPMMQFGKVKISTLKCAQPPNGRGRPDPASLAKLRGGRARARGQ